MTADDMKLGDDCHRIDVTRDEENRGMTIIFYVFSNYVLGMAKINVN